MKRAEHYRTRWETLNREIEEQALLIAHALRSEKESIELKVGHYDVRIGDYEPIVNGYPLLESIQVTTEGLFVQLELIEEYAALGEITTLSIPDKIEILKILQSEFYKTHYP